ncbi:MAG: PilX N-terminal domain-containing pilus assembly protein [Nevskia sp.]|nr:PilX N-terminal domain-containing pilus assembly protein [Nevskia sp.]
MSRAPKAQRGVVLLVGLIILVVLSLLAIASIRSTTLEERMTGNSQDQQIAFQVAEAALREAEAILGQPMLPAFVAVSDPAGAGFYLADLPNPNTPATVYKPLWLRTPTDAGYPVWRQAEVTTDAPPPPIDRARGEYLIEQVETEEEASPGESLQADSAEDRRERIIYRITARAWGAATADQAAPTVLLQSTFKR